jgi:hypothetical protein
VFPEQESDMATNAAAVTKLALLIDGDNVSASYMPLILREAEKIGVVAIRRLYGQFKTDRMKSWLKQAEVFDLTKVNVSPLTRGKNATDMKLVIEAMDMLTGRQPDGFLIASSDGDFTPLVARIRASAVLCFGFGMKKAPAGYKAEFDQFYECDTMLAAEKQQKKPAAIRSKPPPANASPLAPLPATEAAHDLVQPTQTRSPPPRSSARPKRQAAPPPGSANARSAREEIPLHVVQAILKLVRAHSGSASFRDLGNELPTEVPKFKSTAYGFSTTKAMLKALNGRHGLEVTKDGKVLLALT